jgi:hypothetical protein
MRPSPAIAGQAQGGVASLGVFALFEGAVGDLAQQAGVVVEGADIAPVESPRVYWRVKLSKDELHGTEKISPEVHG